MFTSFDISFCLLKFRSDWDHKKKSVDKRVSRCISRRVPCLLSRAARTPKEYGRGRLYSFLLVQ